MSDADPPQERVKPPALRKYCIISDAIRKAILPGLRKAEKYDHVEFKHAAADHSTADIVHNYIMAELDLVVDWEG